MPNRAVDIGNDPTRTAYNVVVVVPDPRLVTSRRT